MWAKLMRSAVVVLAMGGVVVPFTSCREDMQNQPRLKPMRPMNLPSQQTPMAPIYGTISRDETGSSYAESGYNGNVLGNAIPFPVNKAVLERGRQRYDIYCAPCHARTGDGNGIIVQRGYRRPPSYHSDRLRTVPLGHFFEVITNGFGAMPDYRAQIHPHDRWAIAAYIRALQLSQYAPASLAPAGVQMEAEPNLPGLPGTGATPAQAAPQSGNVQAAEGPPSELQRKSEREKEKREQKAREAEQK